MTNTLKGYQVLCKLAQKDYEIIETGNRVDIINPLGKHVYKINDMDEISLQQLNSLAMMLL